MTERELLDLAVTARERAYAPYSGFRVGAALLSGMGRVYLGCNIENAAYSATVCAERVALFRAVSEGERDFSALAIAGGADALNPACPPCGVCRQALSEFCPPDMPVILGDAEHLTVYRLSELLPLGFSGQDLT